MTQIITNLTSYSEHRPEDGVKDNWAAEYAKREVDKHREAEVLDHPDGSVTVEKLSDGLRARISEAYETAQTASETASTAKATADSAKVVSDIAKTTAENAEFIATGADAIAVNAKGTAEDALLVAESAEEKANSALVSTSISGSVANTALDEALKAINIASGAVQKAETVQSDLEEHINNSDVHTFAEEKADVNERIHTAQLTAEDAKDEAQNVYSLLLLVEDEIVKKLDTKADKDTTLDGYGITDAYTKTEIDAQLGDIETALDNIITIQNELMGVSE